MGFSNCRPRALLIYPDSCLSRCYYASHGCDTIHVVAVVAKAALEDTIKYDV